MGDVKWIKLSTRMFDDEKIKLIEQMPDADSMLVIWIKLLSQAGKTNASGYIYLSENIPYTDEMLAAIFNRPLSVIRLALKTFKSLGMLEMDDGDFISIANWEKHQNVDGLEKIREQNRVRKQKEREKKKLMLNNSDSHVTVTQGHATELELELDKNKDIPSKSDADALSIYEHYISKNVIQHKSFTTSMKGKVKTALKTYSVDDIKKIIDNFSNIYKSKLYYFDSPYSLVDIMRKKDLEQFSDEYRPYEKFAINKANNYKTATKSEPLRESNSVDASDILKGMTWD